MFRKKIVLIHFILLVLCSVHLAVAAPGLQKRAGATSSDASQSLSQIQDGQKQLDDASAGSPHNKVLVSKKAADKPKKVVPPKVLAASDSDPTDLPSTTTTPPELTPDDPASTTATSSSSTITPAPTVTSSNTVIMVPPVTIVTQLNNYSAVVVASQGQTSTVTLPQPSGTGAANPVKSVVTTASYPSAAMRMSSSPSFLIVASVLVGLWALI